MDISERLIALTDIETSGLDPNIHEIIEIGLVLFNQSTFRIVDTLDLKVRPKSPEIFDKRAQEVNGYNEQDWLHAVSLEVAMKTYGEMTHDAVFCAYNVTFDWGFIGRAFQKTGVPCLMDYHRLDLMSMAWLLLVPRGLKKINMKEVARFLGINEEPLPHRAINGAMTEYEIFCALMKILRE